MRKTQKQVSISPQDPTEFKAITKLWWKAFKYWLQSRINVSTPLWMTISLFILSTVGAVTIWNRLVAPQVAPVTITQNFGNGTLDPPEIVDPEASQSSEDPLVVYNEAAPVAAGLQAPKNVQDYIARFHRVAIVEQRKFGIPASISLAQGIIESRSGSSKLAVQANNHFGIKCFSKKCGRGHCINMHDDHAKDFFRKYPTAWESWRAHSKMLAEGRYARLKKHGRDYRKWAYGLKKAGYATDRTYAEKLIGVIEANNLQRFDKQP